MRIFILWTKRFDEPLFISYSFNNWANFNFFFLILFFLIFTTPGKFLYLMSVFLHIIYLWKKIIVFLIKVYLFEKQGILKWKMKNYFHKIFFVVWFDTEFFFKRNLLLSGDRFHFLIQSCFRKWFIFNMMYLFTLYSFLANIFFVAGHCQNQECVFKLEKSYQREKLLGVSWGVTF